MIGIGDATSQASMSRWKWLETAKASRLLAMVCPITCWSRTVTRVLGVSCFSRKWRNATSEL